MGLFKTVGALLQTQCNGHGEDATVREKTERLGFWMIFLATGDGL